MSVERISEKFTFPSKFIEVNGERMHYIDVGEGDPIIFLHGIPTNCYLWRNIIPHLSTLGRCIAPDLIGFGKSAKPDIEYTVFEHINYIEQFIKVLNLKKVLLVMHGWGSVIGFSYVMHHEKNCSGLVFYEAFLRSIDSDDISLPYQEQLVSLDNQGAMFDITASGALFVDQIIPQTALRELSDEEMNHYRQPFQKEGSGKPITQYLKEIPKGDGKSKIDKLIADYSQFLTRSSLPKLMLYSLPGFITTIATVMWAKEHLPNLEIIELGEDMHFAQESCPTLMSEAISVWMQGLEQGY